MTQACVISLDCLSASFFPFRVILSSSSQMKQVSLIPQWLSRSPTRTPQPNSFSFSFLNMRLHRIMPARLSWLDPEQNSSGPRRRKKTFKFPMQPENPAKAVSVVTVAVVEHVSWFTGYFSPAFPVLIPAEAKREVEKDGGMDGWAGHFLWM